MNLTVHDITKFHIGNVKITHDPDGGQFESRRIVGITAKREKVEILLFGKTPGDLENLKEDPSLKPF